MDGRVKPGQDGWKLVDGRVNPRIKSRDGHDALRLSINKFARQLHPVVAPQVSHLRQVPLRTMVKLPHSGQASPTRSFAATLGVRSQRGTPRAGSGAPSVHSDDGLVLSTATPLPRAIRWRQRLASRRVRLLSRPAAAWTDLLVYAGTRRWSSGWNCVLLHWRHPLAYAELLTAPSG